MSENYSRAELVAKAPGYGLKLARRRLARQYRRLYFHRRPDHRALRRADAESLLRSASSVLFLCWGNVCRSPLAERYLEARLEARGVDGVDVRSAGLGSVDGRPSPDTAVAAASALDVDLGDHRSELATEPLVSGSDVVFVMDLNNYHSVASSFPEATQRVFFLGVLSGDGEPDGFREVLIPDPDGADRATFDDVYDDVTAAVDAVADVLEDAA